MSKHTAIDHRPYFEDVLDFSGPHNWQRTNGQSWRELVDQNTPQSLELIGGQPLDANKAAVDSGTALFASAQVQDSSRGWASAFREDMDRVIAAAQAHN